jgi:hypothetical protein
MPTTDRPLAAEEVIRSLELVPQRVLLALLLAAGAFLFGITPLQLTDLKDQLHRHFAPLPV